MVPRSLVFDLGADIAKPATFIGGLDRKLQRFFRDAQQLICPFVDHPYRYRLGSVPDPAILDDADIEFHNVAVLNTPLTADAVYDFIVERNANISRKNAMPEAITEKSAFHFRIGHEISGRFIYFFRRNARSDQLRHTVEDIARRAA